MNTTTLRYGSTGHGPPLPASVRAGANRVEIRTETGLGAGKLFQQLLAGEHDIADFPIAELAALTAGDAGAPCIGLAVFPSARRFFHTEILVRADSGVYAPSQLVGRSVGTAQPLQGGGVWSRGVLGEEFGLDLQGTRWVTERAAPVPPLPDPDATTPLSFERAPAGRSVLDLLIDGDIDAVLSGSARALSSRPADAESVRFLFDPPSVEARRYFASTRLLPIAHCVAVRREVAATHGWLLEALTDAFVEARSAESPGPTPTQMVERGGLAVRSEDLEPFGLEANHPEIDTLTRYLHQQGLVPRRVAPEELFHSASR